MRSSTMAREQAEHFWPWKPKADAVTPSTAESMSGVGVDDDGVLYRPSEDGALDPHLARDHLGGTPVDIEPHFAGTGESNEARLGMADQGIAESCACAGTEVDHAFWETGLFEHFDKFCGDGRRVA